MRVMCYAKKSVQKLQNHSDLELIFIAFNWHYWSHGVFVFLFHTHTLKFVMRNSRSKISLVWPYREIHVFINFIVVCSYLLLMSITSQNL